MKLYTHCAPGYHTIPYIIRVTVTRCKLLVARGARSCLSVRTQPPTATGAPLQTSTIPYHTIHTHDNNHYYTKHSKRVCMSVRSMAQHTCTSSTPCLSLSPPLCACASLLSFSLSLSLSLSLCVCVCVFHTHAHTLSLPSIEGGTVMLPKWQYQSTRRCLTHHSGKRASHTGWRTKEDKATCHVHVLCILKQQPVFAC